MARLNQARGGVGISALAVQLPSEVRTNDFWRERHPTLVAEARDRTLARVFSNQGPAETLFDQAMAPFLDDPFRGTVERRVVSGDEDSLSLELGAARQVLAASGRAPDEVDLLISVGFLPRDLGIGNAVHLARALELRGAAWNLESACAGPLQSLITACALVQAGQHERVLVTTSCTYSMRALSDDSLSWFLGDGAGAFLVEPQGAGVGLLGNHAIHTGDTCGTWRYDLELDSAGAPRVTMRASPRTGRIMRASAEPHLRACCEGALDDAGLGLDQIDAFVFHTPVAWFAPFAAAVLGVDPDRVVNPYRYYANVGPALTPANLHYAARTRRLTPGQTVLVFGPGSASSAAAVVMRWGEVALGDDPPGVFDAPTPA